MIPGGLSPSLRPTDVNYDESLVPSFELPDPLTCVDGSRVDTVNQWRAQRRSELVELFTREIYGRVPGRARVSVNTVCHEPRALAGFATRLELDVRLASNEQEPRHVLRLLVWLPNHVLREVPVFLGLNYFGNQTVHPDPHIRLAQGWVPNDPELGIFENRATPASRGLRARRWPVEMLLIRGYGLATLYGGDIDPDFDDGFVNGVHGWLESAVHAPRQPDAWGSIAAWAWGLSRALDALLSIERIDARRIGVIGHSRFGKAALWAAAQDERFAFAISNNSGHAGASISRRCFGERMRHLQDRFPHWFAPRLRHYDDRESELPIDQHELLALLAPRPVYVASSALDLWSDPAGEHLACVHASPVYELHDLVGIDPVVHDELLSPKQGLIGYHCRPGSHDMLATDWWHYVDFVDRHVK